MKAYKLEILILDFDECGADGITQIIENEKYPNHCIRPDVKKITEADIGEWTDGHPLNHRATSAAEYQRLFAPNDKLSDSHPR